MISSYASFDRSEFPLVIVTFTGAKPTSDNFLEYLAELKTNYEERIPIGILFDATLAPFPAPKFQQQQAQWIKHHENMIKAHCVVNAFVLPNIIIRNALRLILKIQSNPVPYKVFQTLHDAKKWTKEQLENT